MADLLLVDGHNLAFRSFYGIGPLNRRDGFPTGALYGWITTLWHLQDAVRPGRTVAFFDRGRSVFRREILPIYKAQRAKTPDDLRRQLPHIREAAELMGATAIEREGVEADDLLAALAVREAGAGKTVAIASSDKDFAQIVCERIILWRPPAAGNGSGDWVPMDSAAVEEKFGVEPRSIVDYLTLVGDASDNIPGVPGVGAKTAAKWLRAYGSVEGIRRHLHELPPRLGENFQAAEESILRNQRLIRFDLYLSLPPVPRQDPVDLAKFLEFLGTFQLHSLRQRAIHRY